MPIVKGDKKKCIAPIIAVAASAVMTTFIALYFFGNTFILKSFERNPAKGLVIAYPLNGTIFPPELVAPTFRWNDARTTDNTWVIAVGFDNFNKHWEFRVHKQFWRPDKALWESIKKLSIDYAAHITIIGFHQGFGAKNICGDAITFTTSKDPVNNPLFYRDVVLPFSEAVKDPSRLKWRFGAISDERMPPVVLP